MPYHFMGDFQVKERMIRYSIFVPRFYNLCKSFGFTPGKIMPSRAFCSDENQGYPIILITKHFGTFPFNHGRVGGVVATGRHGPHAHHGTDLVLIQASHVGYDPETGQFGSYRRLQMDSQPLTSSCGKIAGVSAWYHDQYAFARENISFTRIDGGEAVVIDNHLLNPERTEGLMLALDRLIAPKKGIEPLHVFSTSKAFAAHPNLRVQLPESVWQPDRRTPIGNWLTANLFHFKRDIPAAAEGHDHLEHNLSHNMPQIVTAGSPALAAAQANTQVEFDRTYRTIITEPGYKGRNLAFIAGINIDISPREGQLFPLTKFVPWAAYIQTRDGMQTVMEQKELMDRLKSQPAENADQIDLEEAIDMMARMPEVKIAM